MREEWEGKKLQTRWIELVKGARKKQEAVEPHIHVYKSYLEGAARVYRFLTIAVLGFWGFSNGSRI
jgi:hypothetical protein